MKKIKLNETDLMKIVKRVLNEQEIRQFNEDEIDFLRWIFEREFKPPFMKGEVHSSGWANYYNRDDKCVGYLESDGYFRVRESFLSNIEHKVCQVFEFSYDTMEWWLTIYHHLKSWLEDQLNVNLRNIN